MVKNKSMIENAAILFIAMGITKVVGAVLKIPLGNILGGLGMSYFSSAYSVFGPVFALTAAAIPTVMTKLVAQNAAAGRFRNVRKIRKVALRAAALLGFGGTVLILIITVPFARFVADAPKSIPSMLLIAPSVFFCCVASVYRGYYEGLRNTLPTAISQVIEAVVKAALGITLSYFVLAKTGSLPLAAAASVVGIAVSEVVGLLYLFLRSFTSDGISKEELDFSPPPESGMKLLRRFFTEAFPITLGALVINISSLIDLLTITNCINLAITADRTFFLREFIYGLQGEIKLNDLGNFIYGSYTGIVASLFTLIPAMTAMLSKSALPAIAAAWERQNMTRLSLSLKILFKGTLMLGLPLCLGMAVFSEQILTLLYISKPAEAYVCIKPLFILSLGGITLSLTGTLFSVFLAIGRADLPVKLMLAGAAVKLGLNLWLIRIPELNISGAAIGTIGCYSVICVLGFICFARIIRIKIGIPAFFAKAFVNSVLCAAAAFIAYSFIFDGAGDILRLCFSIMTGGGVYVLGSMFSDNKMLRSYLFNKGKC
jgi:stage V sporulation protein B